MKSKQRGCHRLQTSGVYPAFGAGLAQPVYTITCFGGLASSLLVQPFLTKHMTVSCSPEQCLWKIPTRLLRELIHFSNYAFAAGKEATREKLLCFYIFL